MSGPSNLKWLLAGPVKKQNLTTLSLYIESGDRHDFGRGIEFFVFCFTITSVT